MNTCFFILFGKPGAGKSYAADVLEKHFGFVIHDGDEDIPDDMRKALYHKQQITDSMRADFLENMISSVHQITHNKQQGTTNYLFAVHQTLLKEFMRKTFMKEFPDAKFLLIECDDNIREMRYVKRAYFNLGIEYLRHMTRLFEEPRIPHLVIDNNTEGPEEIKKQLQNIIRGNP
jgi:gluconate kinase